MSQLHGELMEFHEILQRNLVKKEKIMTKMREELVCLRGPVYQSISLFSVLFIQRFNQLSTVSNFTDFILLFLLI